MDSYSESTYHHIIDERTPEQRIKQHLLVEELVIRNLKTLGINMTDKKKTQYKPRQRLRVDLGEGWYCNISDSGVKQKHTFLTLHGAPGDHVQWAGLEKQMGGCVRWVNLTIPGFDGQDERRGNYDGSADHLCKLIEKLMKVLSIPKIILCGHSLGNIFGTYFATKHPHLLEGYINITGIVDHWYTGLLTFFQTVVTDNGYNSKEWREKRLFDDDHERILIHHKFLQNAEGRFFGPVQFPKLTMTEMFGYMRLINSFPSGLSEIYGLNEKLSIFRVLIFGKKDPLHQHHKTQASIANLCWGNKSYLKLSKYKKLFSSAKSRIEERLKKQFNITVDGQKIQQYFCYHLEDTGHNAHKRRPIELSKIFKIYIACIQQLSGAQTLSLSKL